MSGKQQTNSGKSSSSSASSSIWAVLMQYTALLAAKCTLVVCLLSVSQALALQVEGSAAAPAVITHHQVVLSLHVIFVLLRLGSTG